MALGLFDVQYFSPSGLVPILVHLNLIESLVKALCILRSMVEAVTCLHLLFATQICKLHMQLQKYAMHS